jgi:hypothetical protein
MVQLLFTSKQAFGSRTISWATGSKASHMAVRLVRERLVYHFMPDGLTIDNAADFMTSHTVQDKIDLPLTEAQRTTFVVAFIGLTPKHTYQYDYAAFAWWGWQAVITKLTGRAVPVRNKSNRRYGFLCTELLYMVHAAYVEAANRWLISSLVDIAAMTPDAVAAYVRKEIASWSAQR